MAAGPFPTQHQNTQQLTNSLTRKENGPRVLLTPPTDRLHSLQTYNNTKEKKKQKTKNKNQNQQPKQQSKPTPPNITQLQKMDAVALASPTPSAKPDSSGCSPDPEAQSQGMPTPGTPPASPESRLSSNCSFPDLIQPVGHWESSHVAARRHRAAGSTSLPSRILEPRSVVWSHPLPALTQEGWSCTAAHCYRSEIRQQCSLSSQGIEVTGFWAVHTIFLLAKATTEVDAAGPTLQWRLAEGWHPASRSEPKG